MRDSGDTKGTWDKNDTNSWSHRKRHCCWSHKTDSTAVRSVTCESIRFLWEGSISESWGLWSCCYCPVWSLWPSTRQSGPVPFRNKRGSEREKKTQKQFILVLGSMKKKCISLYFLKLYWIHGIWRYLFFMHDQVLTRCTTDRGKNCSRLTYNTLFYCHDVWIL